ncbi:hypothetical protein COO60DRAFT_344167 [Scenedesmus sp. NREL 46B-D3]|nr:hypothetical protein COO60DRAFT_344167 [Scenedesmus sp. NREL 46B-D3]
MPDLLMLRRGSLLWCAGDLQHLWFEARHQLQPAQQLHQLLLPRQRQHVFVKRHAHVGRVVLLAHLLLQPARGTPRKQVQRCRWRSGGDCYRCVAGAQLSQDALKIGDRLHYITLHAPPNKEWEPHSGANERLIGLHVCRRHQQRLAGKKPHGMTFSGTQPVHTHS